MGLRRKSREIALQFLFAQDVKGLPLDREAVEEELDRFSRNFATGKKSWPYARQLIQGICTNREAIDRQLVQHSHNWRLERMSPVDRNILRIAVYEMQHGVEVPARVAINEALEVAKRYSMPDSVAFINGILDALQDDKT
ncbi:MAG TPA: transcription antitermination factor NusB [Desulfobacteraceae bacterium]|nr:transcription antitermination factor NusB [Desulfobacteraceae bacterium]